MIELGQNPAPGELEQRLRTVLQDPTLAVLHWSDASGAYLDGTGRPARLPAKGARRGVTYLERQGRRTTALVHDPAVLKDPDLASTVLEAVRFVVEQDRLRGRIEATATLAAALPTGFVTFLMSDIEDSTVLLRKLGDRYGALLNDVRGILRTAVARAGGREIDARADELFAVFERAPAAIEAAVAIQRELGDRAWAERVEVRLRIGIHSGRPTLTDAGYIGLPVHTTARLCSAAHGGQIVVSGATRAVDRHVGAERRAVPEPRAASSARSAGGRDALPGPGAGAARGLSAAPAPASRRPPPEARRPPRGPRAPESPGPGPAGAARAAELKSFAVARLPARRPLSGPAAGQYNPGHVAGAADISAHSWRLPMTHGRSWLALVLVLLTARAGPRGAGRRADAVRLRQREPLRHHGPARGLRRRPGGGAPEPVRRALPLARQPAEARAVAGREPHRLPRRPHLHLQAAPRAPSSTTAPRSPRRTCATAPSASSRMKKGAAVAARHHDRARRDQGARPATPSSSRSPSPPPSSWRWCPRSTWSTPALLKKNEKDGDWGAAWLTEQRGRLGLVHAHPLRSRRSGSSPSASPATSCRGGPKYIDEIEFRIVKEDNTRVLGMIKGDYQGTGGYLPNDQVKRLREAPNVKIVEQESMRHHDVPDQQPARAAERRARAPRHQLRLRLRRLQQGDPRRLRRAQPGADPEQPVGRAARREGLHLRPRQGQAGAGARQGQGRPAAHRGLPRRASARPSRRPR